ncbi:MAG: GNAT family N-acetyltransferase, partial [Proteobacteria bacterium]|nr:GNAT family N-acetyltransferase [Pseudomonadota bacterium]
KQSDAAAIAATHVQTWQTAYRGIIPDEFLAKLSIADRQNFWEKHLAALPAGSHIYVAVDSKAQVLGFSSAGPNRDQEYPYDGEVMALYLLKEQQGHGIGRHLFQASIDCLVDSGCRKMLVWVLAQNPTCLFYAHLGGRPIAEKIVTIGGTPLKELAYVWEDLPALATQKRIYHITSEAA